MRPSSLTASRSAASSAAEASILARDGSLTGSPWMISHSPFAERTGKELMRPSGTPYEPSEMTAADVHSVPLTQSYTWSMAALAADAADDAPRALMIAAP